MTRSSPRRMPRTSMVQTRRTTPPHPHLSHRRAPRRPTLTTRCSPTRRRTTRRATRSRRRARARRRPSGGSRRSGSAGARRRSAGRARSVSAAGPRSGACPSLSLSFEPAVDSVRRAHALSHLLAAATLPSSISRPSRTARPRSPRLRSLRTRRRPSSSRRACTARSGKLPSSTPAAPTRLSRATRRRARA